MRTILLLKLLLVSLVIFAAAKENGTQKVKKTLRSSKLAKKSSKAIKKSTKSTEQIKSESYRIPIVVSPTDEAHHNGVPLSIELRDGYVQSAGGEVHHFEPVHVVPLNADLHQQQPLFVESVEPFYSHNLANEQQGNHNYGPAPVPQDYPHGGQHHSQDDHHYQQEAAIAPQEYYPENYGDLSAIPGTPGVDYPTYSHLPPTRFKCLEHTSTPGFYADVETKCQVWHYCQPDGRHDRFLCPNGTVFDQLTRVCNWWFNVLCDASLDHYDINFDLYREPAQKTVPQQSLEADYQHQGSTLQHPTHAHEVSHRPSYVQEPSHNLAYGQETSHPNSFLGHVQEFEAAVHGDGNHHAQVNDDIYSIRPIQSAASPQVHHYPIQLPSEPKIRTEEHEYSVVPISYDSSNAHAMSAPRRKVVRQRTDSDLHRPGQEKKRSHRRKLRKNRKIYPKDGDDDIPTYREAKASPSRRFRVVKRKRISKV